MTASKSLRFLRHTTRYAPGLTKPTSSTIRPQFRSVSTSSSKPISHTPRRKDSSDPYHKASTEATGTSAGPHEGSASRTDKEIVVEYPDDEKDLPPERPLRGRGGVQYVRTLPTFSLEGRTAVVTGGARGLGLVMGQALVSSGADLAIVDLNSKLHHQN